MSMDSEYLWSIGASYGPSVVMEGEVWRLFSAMFLHGGLEHILMNMFSLYLVGRSVEMIFSRVSYLSIYLISGLIGSLTSIYFHPVTVAIGASGAIFGIFGSVVGFALIYRHQMHSQFQDFIKSVGVVLLLNLGIGLIFPSVDMSAHIGGLLAGLVGGAMVAKSYKNIWLFVILMMILSAVVYSYLPSLYS